MINGKQRIKQKLSTLGQKQSNIFLPFSQWPRSNFQIPNHGHIFITLISDALLWPGTVAIVTVIRQLSVVCPMM